MQNINGDYQANHLEEEILNGKIKHLIDKEVCEFFEIDELSLYNCDSFSTQRGVKFENEFYSISRLPMIICNYLYLQLFEEYEEWFDSMHFIATVKYCMHMIETDEEFADMVFTIESNCMFNSESPHLIKNHLNRYRKLDEQYHHILNDYQTLCREKEKQIEKAELDNLLIEAEKGDLQAQITVSEYYDKGYGTDVDTVQAFEWR